MKHTPGPWIGCHDGECKCGNIFGDGGEVFVGEAFGPYHLGDGVDGPAPVPPREQQIANAKLMIAAPDLLEALKGVVAGRTTDVFERARAAIAKAEQADE